MNWVLWSVALVITFNIWFVAALSVRADGKEKQEARITNANSNPSHPSEIS